MVGQVVLFIICVILLVLMAFLNRKQEESPEKPRIKTISTITGGITKDRVIYSVKIDYGPGVKPVVGEVISYYIKNRILESFSDELSQDYFDDLVEEFGVKSITLTKET